MSAIQRLLRRPLPRTHFPGFTLRSASTHNPHKVLSKPTKFTPPSHPSLRPLARDPINYPGPPQPPRDPSRRYPRTMPPPNTWSNYLLTSQRIHYFITIGILMVLAATITVKNFQRTSSFGDRLYWHWLHPIASVRDNLFTLRDHVNEESLRVAAMRKKVVDDMDLRGEYRRAHGLERYGDEGGFGGWSVKISGREPGRPSPVVMPSTPVPRKDDWIEDEIEEAEKEEAKRVETKSLETKMIEAKRAEVAAAAARRAEAEAEAAKQAALEGGKKKNSWW